MLKKEAGKTVKSYRPYVRNSVHVGCKNKSDTGNNRGNWNHLKVIQKIPVQYNIKGKLDIKELEKAATFGTAYILWKVLMYKCKTFTVRSNITCTIYCNHRIAPKLYTLENLFVPCNIINCKYLA